MPSGPPVIRTDRLLLRPRTIHDLDACLAMDRDPAVTRYVPGPWAHPRAHRAFVLDRMERAYPDGMGYWTAIRRDGPGAFLGWVMLLPCADGEAEIGWRFRRAVWGKGYASEAGTALLAHARRLPGLRRIVADIDAENRASIRVAEKLGMQACGTGMSKGRPVQIWEATGAGLGNAPPMD